ncbi:transporter substrate-binding domain-containing protein [Deefgea tanakiae]|uniref:Transporter substrate-binding domain-containing protein n=1 Tax=Deefgea tanakiae TaxID=2865840 RepID=A0ABX8Z7W4_9NEIS|nr:transporter substrate-binding domain-containing protein [Deefgea tanakiae]QZA78682.1 transporter substrate-binding domain-containing protein [Deefgea tanakiae]
MLKFVLLIAVLWMPLVWAQTPLQVRFAPEKDYGPFIYQDEQGQIRGLSWDILQAIAEPAALQIQTLPASSLASILEMAKLGQIDLISSLRPTAERSEYLSFTYPYVAVPAVLIARDDGAAVDLFSLQGKSVAVGKGYAVESFVQDKFPNIAWLAVNDDREALLLLKQGKVDALVADIASVIFIAKAEQYRQWRVVQNIGFQYQLSFAYPKGQVEIGQRLNQALLSMPLAQREALLARWLNPEQIKDAIPYSLILKYSAAVLAGLALLCALWLWRRRGSSA